MTLYAELSGYDKQGLQLIRIVISDKGKRKRIPTKIFVDPKHWDEDKQRVKPSAPNAGIINQALSIQLADLQKSIAVSGVEEMIIKKKMPLYDFIDEMEKKLIQRNKDVTMGEWRSQVKKLKEFAPNVYLQDVNSDFLEQFESWCRNVRGNQDGGVNYALQVVTQIINRGIDKGLIPANQIEGFEPKNYRPKNKIHLTREEINLMESILPDLSGVGKILVFHFLLSCYTGLRYKDCTRLNKGMISDGRLLLYTNKTGEPVSLKITPKIDYLIKECLKAGKLPPNNVTNPIMPKLAKKAGIKKHVTFHVARGSFAVQCANLGIPIEHTSRLLGHTDIKTTAIYYKIINPTLDKAMEKWI